jgi:hypothetical protein
MAIVHFTRLCAFFRAFFNKLGLSLAYRSSPDQFSQVVSLALCGRRIFVSNFPALVPGLSEPPGWYFVDSLVFHHTGFIEIGLGIIDVEYYDISAIEITDIEVTNVR